MTIYKNSSSNSYPKNKNRFFSREVIQTAKNNNIAQVTCPK